jgi:uncharacterized protein YndB with AHSA1/START domain
MMNSPITLPPVVIRAPREVVWRALTDVSSMKAWMGEPEMALDIVTDWTVGGRIVIRGVHHEPFENRGTVLRFEPPGSLSYSHQSSLSRLPYLPENSSVFDFLLTALDGSTTLTLTLTGFPTPEVKSHLAFYWRVTLAILQRFVEASPSATPRAMTCHPNRGSTFVIWARRPCPRRGRSGFVTTIGRRAGSTRAAAAEHRPG